jgi:outer membrane protein assembly factor BamD (BamD/ComL family)
MRALPFRALSSFALVTLCCLALAAQTLDSLLSQGEQLLNAGNFAAAAAKFEQARQQAPDSQVAWRGSLLSTLQARKPSAPTWSRSTGPPARDKSCPT